MGEVAFDRAGGEEGVVSGVWGEGTEVVLVFSPAGAFERQADAKTMRSERNITPTDRIGTNWTEGLLTVAHYSLP
ncbi:hypothetical protein [Thermococcus sp. MV11]|uniref:hypothetical protein n=1 Tax=Thermococcus sp. MV11 TaxID=1638267 RepID=UPI001F102D23|nr:hypothetical protein [Thermococcus sp. MV11]